MDRSFFLLLLVGILIVVLLARHAPPARDAASPGVRVTVGRYGARLDYDSETSRGGCCG